jgi:hypothetical protein
MRDLHRRHREPSRDAVCYLQHYDLGLVRSRRGNAGAVPRAPHIAQPPRIVVPDCRRRRPVWLLMPGLLFRLR